MAIVVSGGPDAAGSAAVPPSRPFLSLAFGGGGPFGIAYVLGVVDALQEAGVRIGEAPMLGTSAGSWAAACLVTRTTHERLRRVPMIKVPNPQRGALQAIGLDLFGAARSAQVTASAVRLPLGGRVMLSGQEHRLADIVAASSAVPLLFPPVRIGRAFYVDGGVRSLVSANRAAPAEHLLVVAPVAGAMFGPAGRGMEAMLGNEIRSWQNTTGGKGHLVRPNAQIAGLARHPMQLFDKDLAATAYDLAYQQAAALIKVRPGLASLRQSQRGAA